MELLKIKSIKNTKEIKPVYDIHHNIDSKSFYDSHPNIVANNITISNCGRHAGGVIIADADELSKSMPIVGVRGELQTPWTEGMNFRNLEDNGFLKFDFLGLTLLKDVENCIYRILKKQGNPNPTFLEAKKFFDDHLNCRFHKQDDLNVWKHVYEDGRFTGVFQFTASGARNFAMEAKPDNIEELAALTAIYRPGPLKANVHRKYVATKKNKDQIKYDHPIIEEILGPTLGFITFQEQFMLLAQKLAGFNPGESDKLRKTLVKKSLDTLHSKGSERDIAREKFIKGAKELNNVPESVSSKLWEEIVFFSLYGFNKSHAISYAIDSYYAAWLHTHYEKEWLATILQTANGNPKEMEKVISEIKSYGYDIAPVDVNYSGLQWEYSEDVKAFVPPLTSLKGVGDKAVEEIFNFRPYRNLNDLFFNDEGKWKNSKLNKTAFTSLCKMEAMNSLIEFKNGELRNHKQLLEIIIENYAIIKKGKYGITATQYKRALKKGESPELIIDKLLRETQHIDDWNRSQKISNYMTLSNDASNSLLFPPKMLQKIKEKNVESALNIPSGESGIGWFCIIDLINKTTKNGKDFTRLKVVDNDSNSGWIRIWGKFDESMKYTLWLAEVKNDPNWGMQTSMAKMRKIDAYD